jgi:tetratricopeptide (TPR) repeat protein
MSSRIGSCGRSVLVGLALLSGCAEVPVVPPAAPKAAPRLSPQDERVRLAVARHQQLARQYKQAGDLAAAATQYQILTLLAPNDAAFRTELAATRAEISRRVQENLAVGNAARRSGDVDGAAEAMLKVLALDPENAEAARELREIEKQRLSRIQAGRAAKAGGQGAVASAAPRANPPRTPASAASDAYDLEQPLEMFRAGDTAGGLRELRRFVDANPNDKSARNRIGTAVYDKAREQEDQGAREQALALYEQAVSLRGEPGLGWASRIQSLKKALGNEYFEKGAQAYPANAAQAIKDWEASLRFDPQNAKAAARLKDARQAQEKQPPPKK